MFMQKDPRFRGIRLNSFEYWYRTCCIHEIANHNLQNCYGLLPACKNSSHKLFPNFQGVTTNFIVIYRVLKRLAIQTQAYNYPMKNVVFYKAGHKTEVAHV